MLECIFGLLRFHSYFANGKCDQSSSCISRTWDILLQWVEYLSPRRLNFRVPGSPIILMVNVKFFRFVNLIYYSYFRILPSSCSAHNSGALHWLTHWLFKILMINWASGKMHLSYDLCFLLNGIIWLNNELVVAPYRLIAHMWSKAFFHHLWTLGLSCHFTYVKVFSAMGGGD